MHEDVTRPLDPEEWMERLDSRFAYRLGRLVQSAMEHGHDVELVEGYRTKARQRYLYALGRTLEPGRAVVTHTLRSMHMTGRAMDVCGPRGYRESQELWDWLREASGAFGLRTLPGDRGHLEEVI